VPSLPPQPSPTRPPLTDSPSPHPSRHQGLWRQESGLCRSQLRFDRQSSTPAGFGLQHIVPLSYRTSSSSLRIPSPATAWAFYICLITTIFAHRDIPISNIPILNLPFYSARSSRICITSSSKSWGRTHKLHRPGGHGVLSSPGSPLESRALAKSPAHPDGPWGFWRTGRRLRFQVRCDGETALCPDNAVNIPNRLGAAVGRGPQ
jgi:hypothetical protein